PLTPTAPPFPYTTLFRSRRSKLRRRIMARSSSQRTLTSRKSMHIVCFVPFRLALPPDWRADATIFNPSDPSIGQTVKRLALVLRSEEHTSELQSRENLVC